MRGKLKVYTFILFTFILVFCNSKIVKADEVKINNTKLEFNRIYHVDILKGDDSEGDGSVHSPYATIDYVLTLIDDNEAIIIGEGEHELSALTELTIGKEYSIIGQQGKSTILINGQGFNSMNTSNKKVTIIGTIFKPNDTFKNADKRVYAYWNRSSIPSIDFYNCVFMRTGDVPSEGFILWGNSSSSIDKNSGFYNCVIEAKAKWSLDAYGNDIEYINCATLNKINLGSTGVFVTSLEEVTIDEDFNITSEGWKNTGTGLNPDNTVANIGVYGGKFAWKYEDTSVVIDKPVNLTATVVDGAIELNWDGVDAAESYMILRSTTPSAINMVLEKNISNTKYIDKTVEPLTKYYYVIRAVKAEIESENSNIATAMVPEMISNNAILRILLDNGSSVEYEVTTSEVKRFIEWFELKGQGSPFYMFKKNVMGPFKSRKEYVLYDKIYSFEVSEY